MKGAIAFGLVIAAFAASRVAAFAAGVRFDARPIGVVLAVPRSAAPEGSALRELYYLHIQPPLFNLLLA